jgi:predicted RNA-binding protein Jag
MRWHAMDSRERRVIHIALHHVPDVRSESAGSGAQRGVVIYAARRAP